MTRRRRYGVDATPVLGHRTGIGRLVHELLRRLPARLADDEELVLSARTPRQNPLFGVSHAPLLEAARAPRVRLVRHLLPVSVAERIGPALPRLPVDLGAGRLDVFHATNFFLPRTRARGVVTIHDLAFLVFPDHAPYDVRSRFERVTRDAARRAALVIADSDATARDVAERLAVPRERIETIYPGVAAEFFAAGDADRDRARLADRYRVRAPFVLFVGTRHPRKNLIRLLEAFAQVRARAALPHRLVLVGDAGFGDADVQARIARLGLADAVTLPGFVNDADLPAFYRAADALAFPSWYEGFGLPVVEAFASGCPVLTSTGSSLEEVAGDAAALADPSSTEAVAAALERLLTDAPLRARLAAAGRARATRFTWDDAADRHVDVYRRLAAGEDRGG